MSMQFFLLWPLVKKSADRRGIFSGRIRGHGKGFREESPGVPARARGASANKKGKPAGFPFSV